MYKPKKSLGQHFLHSRRIADKLIEALSPSKEDTVIEIGAGKGYITRLLAKKAKKVIALEIDPELIPLLETLKKEYRNIEILQQDVLEFDFHYKDVLLIGNLPYRISGPFVFWLIEKRKKFRKGVFTFQKEFAERLIAERNTSSYSAISVIVQTFFKIKPIVVIPPFHFTPKPKVYSLSLCFYPVTRELKVDEETFINVVKKCFLYRRKTLYNNLCRNFEISEEKLTKLGISKNTRPQELSVKDYERLVYAITSV